MPPARSVNGRASKACEACRRTKTRCYGYNGSSTTCLRCNTLDLPCSLQNGSDDGNFLGPSGPNHDCAAMEARMARLERIVQKLGDFPDSRSSLTPAGDEETGPTESMGVESFSQHTHDVLESGPPLAVIQDVASHSTENLQQPRDRVSQPNIVEKGYLTAHEAHHLLDLFHVHYIRWITLRQNNTHETRAEVQQSPLLFCACCLIAIRHSTLPSARETAALLYYEVKSLLSDTLLHGPQQLDFFQAVLILSLWSTTIGQKPLSIDGWLISGFAIQSAFATNVFNARKDQGSVLLWVRLCLSHLHACVSMRRQSMLRQSDLDQILQSTSLAGLSNYETRMIAELSLYWTIYGAAVANPLPLPRAQAALQTWREEWQFLFAEARSQFLQMSSYFAQLLMYERALHNKSAAVRESLLSEMVRLCTCTLRLAMDTTDDRTRHLTDHIYHIVTFSAITLCRLLCKYHTRVDTQAVIADADNLIVNTARWLRALGSHLHVGHVMADVIDTVHRKLRPDVHMALLPNATHSHPTPEDIVLPGLLAPDFDWDEMFPDWQSLASNELARSDLGMS